MKIKVGDQVKVLTGQDKNKTGKVLATSAKLNRVVVEGINVRKVTQKPSQANQNGGIFNVEKPIDASNVKKITDKEAKELKKDAKVVDTKAKKKVTKEG